MIKLFLLLAIVLTYVKPFENTKIATWKSVFHKLLKEISDKKGQPSSVLNVQTSILDGTVQIPMTPNVVINNFMERAKAFSDSKLIEKTHVEDNALIYQAYRHIHRLQQCAQHKQNSKIFLTHWSMPEVDDKVLVLFNESQMLNYLDDRQNIQGYQEYKNTFSFIERINQVGSIPEDQYMSEILFSLSETEMKRVTSEAIMRDVFIEKVIKLHYDQAATVTDKVLDNLFFDQFYGAGNLHQGWAMLHYAGKGYYFIALFAEDFTQNLQIQIDSNLLVPAGLPTTFQSFWGFKTNVLLVTLLISFLLLG